MIQKISLRIITSTAVLALLVLVSLMVLLKEKVSFAELNYTEYSSVLGENAGGIIPASCESSPPENHAGDCPAAIRTGISTKANPIVVQLNGGGVTNGTSRTISWTSTGATQCIGTWASGFIPTSGSRVVYGACTDADYSINCTDGVFWSGIKSITVFFGGSGCILE
jgi:hypothetical protein